MGHIECYDKTIILGAVAKFRANESPIEALCFLFQPRINLSMSGRYSRFGLESDPIFPLRGLRSIRLVAQLA